MPGAIAGHEPPANENYFRVIFDLPVDSDGRPPVAQESVWVYLPRMASVQVTGS
jgi:hypothetical protein